MKKTVSFFLSFVLLLSAVFCVPGFSASAAVYKPDRKLYSQAYMLLSLDDPSFPVVAEKNQDKRMYPASLTKIVTTMVVLNKVKDLSQKTSCYILLWSILPVTLARCWRSSFPVLRMPLWRR